MNLLLELAGPWSGWRPATCYPDACFCEGIRDGLVQQPANAASSLAFVIVAVMAARDRAAPAGVAGTRAGGVKGVFVLSMVLIGLGSAFYHSSLSFVGQFADLMGMYLIATLVILVAAARYRQLSARATWSAYLLANAVLAASLYAVPELRRWLFAALVVIGVGLEVSGRAARPARVLGAAVGIFVLAFVAWTLDITGTVCRADSWLQGHAVWHVLAAMAAWLLYRHLAEPGTPGREQARGRVRSQQRASGG